VDSPETSRELSKEAGYSFSLLSDPKAETIRRYDLIHTGAGINGQDISRPAEFLVNTEGTIRWRNLTENYWVRARPEQILEAAKLLKQ
jgi:peroxiredoxin